MNDENEDGLIPLDIPSQWVRPSDAMPMDIGPYFAYYRKYGRILVLFDGRWYWYGGDGKRGAEMEAPICYLYVAPVPEEYLQDGCVHEWEPKLSGAPGVYMEYVGVCKHCGKVYEVQP